MNKKELLQKIKAVEGLSQDERAYLINLVNTKKKYGLVWEDKPEDVEELLRTKLPVLKEIKERAIINDDVQVSDSPPLGEPEGAYPNHILIEGDNLHALTALTFTHENKIDLIYIDPPYNTGSKEDFIYNDHYVDKEDSFRHSKWISFMDKRLNIAKRLMVEDGVIFISIGDDEIAQLTLLCNEIFGENNQLGIIARVAKTAGDKGSYFAPSKDYIIAYAKNKNLVSDFKDAVDDSLFKKIEKDGEMKGEKYRDDVAFYQSSLDPMRGCTNQRYWVEAPDGTFVIPPGNIFPNKIEDAEKIIPSTKDDKVWRWSEETYRKKKHLLVFKKTKRSPLIDEKGNRAKYNIYTKSYLSERSSKGKSPRDFLDQFINRKGADFIKQYDINFSFSKPFELIEHFIKITNKPNNITVLDFFAGSGTTLHSVLNLNNADNGSRKCIITTNNENGICDTVTYPRVERIIQGYTNEKGNEMPSFPNNNLFMYKTAFVDREPSLQNKRQLTQLATELLCIKEDCYTETGFTILKEDWHKAFKDNKGKLLFVVYDDMYIEEAVKLLQHAIKDQDFKETKVYVFSNGQYAYAEEFEDIAENITLAALPDAIYKAYQNVLPKENKEFVPELDDEVEVELENQEQNLFNQNNI
jgi:adenine-specific DNA-methyltransferase